MDCHKKEEFHGDGTAYKSKNEIPQRPACKSCHPNGKEAKMETQVAHRQHEGKVSCYGCHSGSAYRNCNDCHGGHAAASPGMILGRSPRDKKVLTTLRLIPTVRDTFAPAGIKMEHFDAVPNYWDTPAHNIKKRTDRTRKCDACHVDRKNFLTKETMIKNGAKANEDLIFVPKAIKN